MKDHSLLKFGPRPGDFQLGSLQSRAAARAQIAASDSDEHAHALLIGRKADGTLVHVRIYEGGRSVEKVIASR